VKEMKIQILDIRKRHYLARFFSSGVNNWRVKYEYDGKIYEENCWAGLDIPNTTSLLLDIRRKIKKREYKDKSMLNLKGKFFELE